MIDLTIKSLPNTVCVNGRDYSIYTDYRLWMRFEIAVSKMKPSDRIDVSYLFKNDHPVQCDIRELFKFSRPKNILPRLLRSSSEIVLDYEIDSDLIYSAFLGQYGIDLIDVSELHWHKFQALLRGLNNTTRLLEVMQARAYEKVTDKSYDPHEEMKLAWRIEGAVSEQDQEELDEFNDLFTRKEDT